MQRRVRQILLASLLLPLYGVLSALGPALHSLSSVDHVKYGSSEKGDGSDHPTEPHTDCPVCHFFAQGQITADSAPILSMDVVRIPPVDDLPIICSALIDRPSAPRAPPCI